MKITDKDIQLIEDAVLNRLSDEDQLLFKDRMKVAHFAKELDAQKHMIESLKSEGRFEMKTSFQKIDKELDKPSNNKRRTIPLYVRWLIAASLIGVVGYLGIYQSESGKNLNVYNKYYEIYPNLIDPITKGAELEGMSPYQLFEIERHEEAQLLFYELGVSDERGFYFALTYLGMEDFETSIKKLKHISNNDAHRFAVPAEWYLALSYLGAKQIESAQSILIDMALEDDHPYSELANKVLRDLE